MNGKAPPCRLLAALLLTLACAAQAETNGYAICVTNEMSGTLSVIDGATHAVSVTIPLGKRPRGIKASPDGSRLYVALSGSPIGGPGVDESTLPPADKSADGIGVVDIESRRLQRVIRGVSDPEQLAVSRDGRKLYVASEDTGTAVVLDEASGALLASMPVGGEPEGVTISPDGGAVYVTSEEDHVVAVIDTHEDKVVARIPVGKRPRAIAFSPDGRLAFVSGENDASVTVIDARARRAIHRIELGDPDLRPMDLAVSADGSALFVTTGRGRTLERIDVDRHARTGGATAGERPWGLGLSPDGRLAYTANGPSGDVSVIDTATMRERMRISVGDRPWGIQVLPTR